MHIGDPHLSEAERDAFVAAVEKSRRYCEFGLGGSSLLAARLGVQTIVAVDSDKAWVDGVRENPEVAPRIADGSMAVLHADIGPTRDWGNPTSEDTARKWPNYIAVAWAEWGRRGVMPDLVFVDGRFRVACCLSVVVASAAGRPPLTMLHDFDDERPHYREVLDFFDLERLEGSLAFLRVREAASGVLALSRLLHRQFDFG